jgi:hypothetical protein
MDLDPSRYSEADRREVDPPIPVETATWSKAGQLDWWVKERLEWLGRVRGEAVSSGGSKPVIFVLLAARCGNRACRSQGSRYSRAVNVTVSTSLDYPCSSRP